MHENLYAFVRCCGVCIGHVCRLTGFIKVESVLNPSVDVTVESAKDVEMLLKIIFDYIFFLSLFVCLFYFITELINAIAADK